VLAGDSTITDIASELKSMLTAPALVPAGSAYATLGDIGISTGAYGSAAGSTNHLVLDSTKLTTALQNNANAVFSVLAGLTGTATLTDASGNPLTTGSSWLQSVSGTPLNVASSGRYAITYNPSNSVNNLSSVFSGTNIGSSATATGTITPGASSALIPGMILNVLPAAQAGTEYVNYQVSSAGVLQNVNNYLNSVLGAGGIFDVEAQGAAQQTTDINHQIASMNSRISQYQQTLQAQFSAMEASLATLQQQAGSLGLQLSNSNSSSGSTSASSR
jgi:flagellar capping protein FliD